MIQLCNPMINCVTRCAVLYFFAHRAPQFIIRLHKFSSGYAILAPGTDVAGDIFCYTFIIYEIIQREGRWGGVEWREAKVLHTYRHTDPLTKQVVEELSLLKNESGSFLY